MRLTEIISHYAVKKYNNLRHIEKTLSTPERTTDKQNNPTDAINVAKQTRANPIHLERDKPSLNSIEKRSSTAENHYPTNSITV